MKTIKNLRCYEEMLIIVDMMDGFVTKENPYLITPIMDTHTNILTENKEFENRIHCTKENGEKVLTSELKSYEKDVIFMERTLARENNAEKFIHGMNVRVKRKVNQKIKK